MKWLCKACGNEITNNLFELIDLSLLNSEDRQDYLPQGSFMINQGDYATQNKGWILINKNDLIHCKNHPDSYRTVGCCGMDGMQGMNKICMCSNEVATERSDCWMAHYTSLNPERVKSIDK